MQRKSSNATKGITHENHPCEKQDEIISLQRERSTPQRCYTMAGAKKSCDREVGTEGIHLFTRASLQFDRTRFFDLEQIKDGNTFNADGMSGELGDEMSCGMGVIGNT